jgi:hypothetical protein
MREYYMYSSDRVLALEPHLATFIPHPLRTALYYGINLIQIIKYRLWLIINSF